MSESSMSESESKRKEVDVDFYRETSARYLGYANGKLYAFVVSMFLGKVDPFDANYRLRGR